MSLIREVEITNTPDVSVVNTVDVNLAKTAFGELAIAETTPEVQVSAVNGLRDDVQQVFAGTGAGVSVVDNNYVLTTGTDATGFSSLLTRRPATYRNGQGLLARLTALFPSGGVTNNIQVAGMINSEDAWGFGYIGATFGIIRGSNGVNELQELTVAGGAAGSETATITVNGTAYSVPLTSGSADHNAYEIAESLSTQVPGYSFSSNDVVVVALSAAPVPAGSFAFNSASAVATWSQISAGTTPAYELIPEASWDFPLGFTLDPSKGNIYQVKLRYLGYGGADFYVFDPDKADFVLVHRYKYSNANTIPSVTDPSFRIGWATQNLGSTVNTTVAGASALGGVEGKKIFDERGRTVFNEISGLGTTRQHLLTLRNRLVMADSINRTNIYPRLLVLSAAHNKTVIFHVDLGATFLGDLIFDYIDEINSSAEYALDIAPTALADGREILTVPVRGTTPVVLDMTKLLDILLSRESVSISVATSSGTGAEADASISWIEDP